MWLGSNSYALIKQRQTSAACDGWQNFSSSMHLHILLLYAVNPTMFPYFLLFDSPTPCYIFYMMYNASHTDEDSQG